MFSLRRLLLVVFLLLLLLLVVLQRLMLPVVLLLLLLRPHLPLLRPLLLWQHYCCCQCFVEVAAARRIGGHAAQLAVSETGVGRERGEKGVRNRKVPIHQETYFAHHSGLRIPTLRHNCFILGKRLGVSLGLAN